MRITPECFAMKASRRGFTCTYHLTKFVDGGHESIRVCPACVHIARERVQVEFWRRHYALGVNPKPSSDWFRNWPTF